MNKEEDIARAAEALKAIRALVEANQAMSEPVDDNILTLNSVVWRSPSETVPDGYLDQIPANDITAIDQAPVADGEPVIAEVPVGEPVITEAEQVATQPAHMPSDPYAIFDLAEPVLQHRILTETTQSQGTPPTEHEIYERAEARRIQQLKILEEREAKRRLAPSPHLQPTPQRPAPLETAEDGGNFADFSLDEHEAMMSTKLPFITPSPRRQVSDDDTQINDGSGLNDSTDHRTDHSISDNVSSKAATAAQIPLHVVADNGVNEGDETNPQEVMRNALRSMIREQIGDWLEDNIGSLIEDALRDPTQGRKTTPNRNTGRSKNTRSKD